MQLTIEIRSYCDSEPMDKQVRRFEQFPVFLGRSSACDYCLRDPSRYISSNHAVISVENGQFILEDTSANGVYLNGSNDPLGRGRSTRLSSDDFITIGDYTLSLKIDNNQRATTSDVFADFPTTTDSRPQNHDEFDPFRGEEPDWTPPSAHTDDPFADIWENPAKDSPADDYPSSAPANNDAHDWSDWDTPTDTEPQRQADKVQPIPGRLAESSDPFSNSADDLDWLPGNNNETVSINPEAFQQPKASAKDPMLASDAAIAPPPAQRPQPAPAGSNEHHHPHHREPSPQSLGSTDPLLQAARLKPSDFTQMSEAELMSKSGQILVRAVDAMMLLLHSRAELKNAMRSDVTTLSRKNNNPLKFSFSAQDALTKLLSDKTDGYMHADAAIAEAVEDLKLHQVAMLDGMRAAVKAAFLEFNPDMLAKKLEKQGGISANIPITREAKLWDLFCQQYDAIRQEAEDDFNELFGSEFRKAYEKRIRQLGRDPDF